MHEDDDNAAADLYAMQGVPNPQMSMFGAGQDIHKMFQVEAENLELVVHEFVLDGIEERMLRT